MSQPTNGPHDQLQRLIRGIGSQVDHVIADGVRRLGGEPVTQVAMFSQSIKCPWDVETGFTAELAGHTLSSELAKGSKASADRIDEAVAVLREDARKGMTTIVESPTKAVVYWNWTYGYTLCTDPGMGASDRSIDFWNFCTMQGHWMPTPEDVLASSLSRIVTDLNPGYRAEAEAAARMRRSEIESGAREKRMHQLLQAVKEARGLETGE